LSIAQQFESDFADAHHRAEATGSDKPIDDVRKQVEAATVHVTSDGNHTFTDGSVLDLIAMAHTPAKQKAKKARPATGDGRKKR
jgi:hypothetical protein